MCSLTLQVQIDEDLWHVRVCATGSTGSIAARCYASADQISDQLQTASAVMQSLFQPGAKRTWVFQLGAFGTDFGGGALELQMSSNAHGKFLVRAAIETEPNPDLPQDSGTFHFMSDTAEADEFLAQLIRVANQQATEAMLTGTSIIPAP